MINVTDIDIIQSQAAGQCIDYVKYGVYNLDWACMREYGYTQFLDKLAGGAFVIVVLSLIIFPVVKLLMLEYYKKDPVKNYFYKILADKLLLTEFIVIYAFLFYIMAVRWFA